VSASSDVYNFLEEDTVLEVTVVRKGNILHIDLDLDS
jgi:hypothetical protein